MKETSLIKTIRRLFDKLHFFRQARLAAVGIKKDEIRVQILEQRVDFLKAAQAKNI